MAEQKPIIQWAEMSAENLELTKMQDARIETLESALRFACVSLFIGGSSGCLQKDADTRRLQMFFATTYALLMESSKSDFDDLLKTSIKRLKETVGKDEFAVFKETMRAIIGNTKRSK